jgi:hypothetical protein
LDHSLALSPSVIAGLDPAIRRLKKLDARVKPAHDAF